MKKLEGKELYRRLQEARNAMKLLQGAQQRNEAQQKIIENYTIIMGNQQRQIELLEELAEKQGLRIEYLEKIVFGRSKKKKDSDDENDSASGSSSTKKKDRNPRDPKTYQREIPKDEEITDTKEYPLGCCPDCSEPLTDKKTVERYLEDIVLGDEKKNPLKTVEKQLIESGWCGNCKKQKSAKPINGSKVFLGENAKIMTVYLSVVMRTSYEQILNIFRDIWHLKISDGEIENILEEHGNRLTRAYEDIEKALLQQTTHKDETTWKTVKDAEGNYGWAETGADTTDTKFLFGKSRGGANAKKLHGASIQVCVTDDYCGYDFLPEEKHQLCWAHPHRKFRDLAESKAITGKAKENCKKTFEDFGKLYKELDNFPGTFEERQAGKEGYVKRFREIAMINEDDSAKIKTYKTTLQQKEKQYFVFIDVKGVKMDNNKAERRLRHIVMKRNISLGSKTGKGAVILEKVYSVVLTWWWRDPANFISNYRHLLA